MKEIWKDIKNFEGKYKVNSKGKILATNFMNRGYQKILTLQTKKDGYQNIQLYKNNKPFTFTIHRLVAMAFIPNPEDKPEVNHKDGDKKNNNVTNLEWATRIENQKHASDNFLSSNGLNHFRCKLSKKDILNIRQSTDTQRSLGRKYGVSHSTIGFIRKNKSYKQVK